MLQPNYSNVEYIVASYLFLIAYKHIIHHLLVSLQVNTAVEAAHFQAALL